MLQDKYGQTRVTKRLAPTQAGAIKLAQRFGDGLICVRYRHDATGTYRYTTIELVVDEAPVRRPAARGAGKLLLVAIRTQPEEVELHRRLQAEGAMWDGKARLWYIERKKARAIGLLNRIV